MAKEIQVGEKVKIKTEYINDMVPFICGTYIHPATKEFDKEDLPVIHFWLGCYLNKMNPVGEVIGYGAEEERSHRRYVQVKITAGNVTTTSFYRHASVTRVKK